MHFLSVFVLLWCKKSPLVGSLFFERLFYFTTSLLEINRFGVYFESRSLRQINIISFYSEDNGYLTRKSKLLLWIVIEYSVKERVKNSDFYCILCTWTCAEVYLRHQLKRQIVPNWCHQKWLIKENIMVKNHSVTPRIHHSIQDHSNDDVQVRKFSKTYDKRNYYFQLLVVFVGSGFLFVLG